MFKKFLDQFKKTTSTDLANTAAKEYERNLFEYQEAAAFNAKMAEFYREGIARLAEKKDNIQ